MAPIRAKTIQEHIGRLQDGGRIGSQSRSGAVEFQEDSMPHFLRERTGEPAALPLPRSP